MANLAFVLVVVLESMAMFGRELVMGLEWCGDMWSLGRVVVRFSVKEPIKLPTKLDIST